MTSRVARDGRRIRVVDVSLMHDDVEVSRASALLIRRTEEPPGNVARPPISDVGSPEGIPSDRWPGQAPGGGTMENRSLRPTGGPEPAARWTRLTIPLVEGVELSQLVRAAAAAEAASPVSNRSAEGLFYKNADTTAYMHRMPVGEWICLEVVARGSTDGVSASECAMHDEQGVFGRAMVACLATPRNEMIGARASESQPAPSGSTS
jgi:acyl-CoA thioesterase